MNRAKAPRAIADKNVTRLGRLLPAQGTNDPIRATSPSPAKMQDAREARAHRRKNGSTRSAQDGGRGRRIRGAPQPFERLTRGSKTVFDRRLEHLREPRL